MGKFAERLSELVRRDGSEKQYLAARFGVKYRQFHNWETGEQEPKFETLMAIADYFGVSTDYLLGRTDDPTPLFDNRKSGGHKLPFEPYRVQIRSIAEELPAWKDRSDIGDFVEWVISSEDLASDRSFKGGFVGKDIEDMLPIIVRDARFIWDDIHRRR